MKIGICDDCLEIRLQIKSMCEAYFTAKSEEYQLILFESGEEVIDYIGVSRNPVIDLLFLDIEMPGINGIQLKDILIESDKVWRITYVSNYITTNNMMDAYGVKTIGFIRKPVSYNMIENKLMITAKELAKNISISIRDIHSQSVIINIEDILFLKAEGSYTYIYTKQIIAERKSALISSKTIGDIEKDTKGSRLIRVHRSFMINPDYLVAFGNTVELRHYSEKIPIGRSYREIAKRKVFEYGKSRIQGRLQ